MVFLRKYNTLLVTGTTAIRVPIIKRGVVDFAVGADWTPVAGDVKILIDGAAAANVTNLPTAVAAGNGAVWEFVLTAAELSGKQIQITIVDAATKAVEDQCFLIETYGNASAMYQADLSAANLPAAANTIANAAVDSILGRDLSATTESGMPKKSLYAAAAKLVNKVDSVVVPGQELVYRSDGTTEHFRQALTTDAAAAPITVVGGAA